MNATQLKQAFADLPPLDEKHGADAWQRRMRKLRQAMEKRDPSKFLGWAMLRGAMFVGDMPFIHDLYDELMADTGTDWRAVITEPGIGNPARLPYAEWTSGNLVLQAAHVKRWMDWSGIHVKDLGSIIEIGGGYGALALVVYRLGFAGHYWLYDFPEMCLMQRYYLDNTIPEASYITFSNTRGVPPNRADLLIAMASWSEMPIKERGPIAAVDTDGYLVSYKPSKGGHNSIYFAEFTASKPDFDWIDFQGSWKRGGHYLLGRRRDDPTD